MMGLMYNRAKNPEYLDDRQLPTRQFDKIVLKVPDVELTKTCNSPIYKGSSLWNSLPRNVQVSENYKQFKFHYKQYLKHI